MYKLIHLLCMQQFHTISHNHIVDMKRMETCMHNKCMGLYGNLAPNIACQQNNEKCPKKISLCTTGLVHAKSPARHTCQAHAG